MSAQISTRSYSHSSSKQLIDGGVYFWDALESKRKESDFAALLWQLRLLPLGVPGILALSKLDSAVLAEAEWLRLPSPMGRHKKTRYTVTVPNVLAGLPLNIIRDFKRAAKCPKVLRTLLKTHLHCVFPSRFSLRSLARLYEARLHEHFAPVMIRICNFRGQDARWPVEILENGDSWISSISTPSDSTQYATKRASNYRSTDGLIKKFRAWARAKPKEAFRFEAPHPDLKRKSPRDWTAYMLLTEVARTAIKTGKPKNPTSLARYLRELLNILQAESRRRKPSRLSRPMQQMHRLLQAARRELGWDVCSSTNDLFRGSPPPRDLLLNLIPFRVLESQLLEEPPASTDVQALTAFVLQMIDIYTGRRLSDFAATTFKDILSENGATDFTLVETKNASAGAIHLPLHRLLPARFQQLLQTWLAAVRTSLPSRMTPFEVVTGVAPPRSREEIRAKLTSAFERLEQEIPTRHHPIRYAFATWAPVAIELARHPWLRDHPKLQPWVRDSAFFEEAQLTQWVEMLGCRTTPAFEVVANILGQSSTNELEVDYCISWPILILISSLRVERSLTDS